MMGVAGAAQQAQFEGYQDSSIARLVGQAALGIPVVGGVIQLGAELVGNASQKREARSLLRYRMGQMIGPTGRAAFEAGERSSGALTTGDAPSTIFERMGLSPEDRAKLGIGVGRAGLSQDILPFIGGLEGWKMLGAEGTATAGALRKGGITDTREQQRVIGEVIGRSLAHGLEEGRLGEVLSLTAQSIASVTTGYVNVQNVLARESFVGGMGPAYQGASASGLVARQSLEALRTGQAGGVSQIMATMAGMKQGLSYTEARLAVERGKVSDEQSLAMMADKIPGLREAFVGQPPGDTLSKSRAAEALALLFPGIPRPVMVDILDRHFGVTKAGGGTGGFPGVEGIRRGSFIDEGDEARKTAERKARGNRVYTEDDAGAAHRVWTNAWGFIKRGITGEPEPTTAPSVATAATTSSSGAPTPAKEQGYFTSLARGWMAPRGTRPDGHGGYVKGNRLHMAQDVDLPPGTEIRAPEDGTVLRIGTTNGPPDQYGMTVTFQGDQSGILYQFHHLEHVGVGKGKVRAGTYLGKTRKKNFPGGDPSHLHVNTSQGGQAVQPSAVMGEAGFSSMVGYGATMGHSLNVMVHDARTTVERITSSVVRPVGQLFGGK